MSDGRAGPDLTAPGVWTFQAGPLGELRWASGTSFATPNVSGVAALLNAYYEHKHSRDIDPMNMRNALLLGVDPWAVGKVWRSQNSMGYGAVDAGQALRKLMKGNLALPYPPTSGQLSPNILGDPVRGQTEVYTGESFGLRPGRTADAILKVSPVTSKVTIDVTGISTPDNSAVAIWPNALEVYVQNARRSAVDPVLAFNWHPYWDGSKFTIVIEDGAWRLNGEAVGYQPMQPGLIKLTLAAGPTNSTGLRLKLRITRENMAEPLTKPVAQGAVEPGDSLLIPVSIPEGVSRATFDLAWTRNWTVFPPSDLDMVILDPVGQIVSTAGATLNAPERAVLENPVPGHWQVLVQAAQMYRPDTFKLYLRTE